MSTHTVNKSFGYFGLQGENTRTPPVNAVPPPPPPPPTASCRLIPDPRRYSPYRTFEHGGETPAAERTPCRKVPMATDSDAELETPPPIGTAPTTVTVNSRHLPSGICQKCIPDKAPSGWE